MAIRFISKATIKNKLARYSSIWDGTAVYNPFTLVGNYDALATVTVPAGGVASITFAGIPQTGYTHLQMRSFVLSSSTASSATMTINGTNGVSHYLSGNGTVASAASDLTKMFFPLVQGSTTSGFGGVTDFLDYANTTKNKTFENL